MFENKLFVIWLFALFLQPIMGPWANSSSRHAKSLLASQFAWWYGIWEN